MPNVSDKGVNVPVWLASGILGFMITAFGWFYSSANTAKEKQEASTAQIMVTLYEIKRDISLSTLNYNYLLDRVKALEAENKQQQAEINQLQRNSRN